MKKMHSGINSALLVVPIFAVPLLAMLLHLNLILTIALYVLVSVVPLSISLIVWSVIKLFGGYKND